MYGTNDKWAETEDKNTIGEYAWYDSNSSNKIHEVKKESTERLQAVRYEQ